MQLTPHPEVNEVLDAVLTSIRGELGDKLVGLYAFGSLVTGDFNLKRSDLDLAAVLTADLNDAEFALLQQMHAEIAKTYPVWHDRIEVGYIAAANLRAFDPKCTIAVISPGEPFHFRTAEYGWLFNLAVLRKQGLVISGPPPKTLIGPISKEDLDRGLFGLMQMWREYVDSPDPHLTHSQQAYPIMTMCRALRAFRTGEFVSKYEAAKWAAKELPEWSELILGSVSWRDDPDGDYGNPVDTYPETLVFTRLVCELILSAIPPSPSQPTTPRRGS